MAKRKPPWPADKVERRKVADLIPAARNARTHSEEQVAQIAASIEEWGWTIPVLIDPKGGIIAGHGRILAAELLGLAEVPVMVARGWSDDKRRAYMIADNQLAINAGWDMEILSGEMADLKADGFDLDLTGFGEIELADILGDLAVGAENDQASVARGSLEKQFGGVPFSVLNAREGAWQDRKRAWLSLGIKSELGRGVGANDMSPQRRKIKPGAMMDQPLESRRVGGGKMAFDVRHGLETWQRDKRNG